MRSTYALPSQLRRIGISSDEEMTDMSRNSDLLYSIMNELTSIINELNRISYGVRNDFQGIGSEKCANVIDSVNQKYIEALRKLKQIDASKL